MENKEQPIHPIQTRDNSQIIGLTKREYFAGLAMQGICSNETSGVEANAERIVFLSIEIADELLKQLENGK